MPDTAPSMTLGEALETGRQIAAHFVAVQRINDFVDAAAALAQGENEMKARIAAASGELERIGQKIAAANEAHAARAQETSKAVADLAAAKAKLKEIGPQLKEAAEAEARVKAAEQKLAALNARIQKASAALGIGTDG